VEVHACHPVLWGLRQEDGAFKTSLDYIARPGLKKWKKNIKKKKKEKPLEH
jgi:hypothetical protein